MSLIPECGRPSAHLVRVLAKTLETTTDYLLGLSDDTSGLQAVIPVKPGQDRWLMVIRYVNDRFPYDDFLAELRPATPAEIAADRTEYSHLYLDWLARD